MASTFGCLGHGAAGLCGLIGCFSAHFTHIAFNLSLIGHCVLPLG
jgi:hypothetical protein